MYNPDITSPDVSDLVKVASSQLSFQMKGPASSQSSSQEASGLIAAAAKQLKAQITESLVPPQAPVKTTLNESALSSVIASTTVAIKDLHWTDAVQVAGAILSICSRKAQFDGDYRAGDNMRKMVGVLDRIVDAG